MAFDLHLPATAHTILFSLMESAAWHAPLVLGYQSYELSLTGQAAYLMAQPASGMAPVGPGVVHHEVDNADS